MAFAGDGEGGKQFFLLRGLNWVKTLIDSSAVRTVDRSYIEQPKRPWSVEVRTDASESSVYMSSSYEMESAEKLLYSAKTSNGFSTSLGAWVGYRGYGFGLSKELTGGEGTSLSFGAMGGSFGINLRITSYKSNTPEFEESYTYGGKTERETDKLLLDDPIRIRSLFLDGYYMFNGKHFSYAAAYDQSLIQRKSAGSLMAGLMYYHTSISYDDNRNWPLVVAMADIGKIRLTQANIGVGYAYNWVPAKGWLVNAMLMPMLTFYNKVEFTLYEPVDDEGWSLYSDKYRNYEGEFYSDSFHLEERNVEKMSNRVTWNFDARLALVYNWERFYLRAYGHFNRFRYSNDNETGRMTDWKVYASLGFRF